MTTATATRSFKTWTNRIESGVFTKSQCNQFSSAVARIAQGMNPHGKEIVLTAEEAEKLVEAIHEHGVRLTDEHTQQGLDWLRKYGQKVLDLPSDALDLFSHFSYHGGVETYGPYDNGSLPLWRINLSDGRAIDYYNAAWQGRPGEGLHGWWWVNK